MTSVPLSAGGARQPIGFTADNSPVFPPCRPTVRKLADQIPGWLRPGVDLATVIPVPAGFSFIWGRNAQTQLVLSGAYARRFRRISGYVGDIQLSVEARGTTTPTQLQVVTLISWRYGNDPRENDESFTFCRINAFDSKSLLTIGGEDFLDCAPTFLPNPAVFIKVGDPVVGFLEPSSGDAKSAHLTGWGKTDFLTWQGARMDTCMVTAVFSSDSLDSSFFSCSTPFPPSPWGLNPDNIFWFGRPTFLSDGNVMGANVGLPQLSAGNLVYARAPQVNFFFASAPLVSDISPTPRCKKEDADLIYRNLDDSHRLFFGHLASPAGTRPLAGAIPGVTGFLGFQISYEKVFPFQCPAW